MSEEFPVLPYFLGSLGVSALVAAFAAPFVISIRRKLERIERKINRMNATTDRMNDRADRILRRVDDIMSH